MSQIGKFYGLIHFISNIRIATIVIEACRNIVMSSKLSAEYYSAQRKIDPSCGEFLHDGSPNNDNRIEIGPCLLYTSDAADE